MSIKTIITKIFTSSIKAQTKMALVVRNDLKMTKGKTAAQCSHASVLCYEKSLNTNPKLLREWCFSGQPKIVLKVENKNDLDNLVHEAQKLNIITAIVSDAGKTQLNPGTTTVAGLGPDSVEKIDEIVKHLKLL